MPSTTAQSDPSPPSPAPLRVLLWAPYGSGNHYHGPASYSHRLYSAAQPGRFDLTLAYGVPEQQTLPLFSAQHLISPLKLRRKRPIDTWRFVRRGRAWVREHARHFDVLHGLTAFHVTLAPAEEAQRLGLPCAIFMAAYGQELTDKTLLRSFRAERSSVPPMPM